MQKKIYDWAMNLAFKLIKMIAGNPLLLFMLSKKTALFMKGQSSVRKDIKDTFSSNGKPVYWFHCSSLGEHGIAFPLMKRLREQKDCTIVLTFFSSTGIEAAKNRGNEKMGADYVYYLPLDTKSNVRFFLDTIRPEKAIFMVSEYWVNYLYRLNDRHIPTYLVSAVITSKTVFFRWFGSIYRKALPTYTQIFVLSKRSKRMLSRLHFHRCTVSGDPLFDNAATKAVMPYENKIIEHFCNGERVFVAGSISDNEDLTLVSSLANNHRDVRFIFVPHEITPQSIAAIKKSVQGKAVCYKDCTEQTDFKDTQILIIDFIGALAQMYRYGTWAYVGGGFTPYLHSVIEPTVYGLPVSFGPMIGRKVPPQEMVHRGIGEVVTKIEEIEEWFRSVQDADVLEGIKTKAQTYVKENQGATMTISQVISD